jgi:hypothetical protein
MIKVWVMVGLNFTQARLQTDLVGILLRSADSFHTKLPGFLHFTLNLV